MWLEIHNHMDRMKEMFLSEEKIRSLIGVKNEDNNQNKDATTIQPVP